MALELATRQIRFNVVAPGYAATDMTADLDHGVLAKSIPLGRLAEVSDVAHAVEVGQGEATADEQRETRDGANWRNVAFLAFAPLTVSAQPFFSI
jgi:NAD(P)-dependent dehydrogenase (short-subunit alcohol dehydrogenase family)